MNHNQLIEYFAQVIQEIFNKVGDATNLTDDKNAQKLITAVLKSLDTLGIKANEVMPQELEKAYLEAVASADKELAVQNVKVEKVEPTQILKRKIHLAALKKLVNDTLVDFKTAIETAKLSAKTNIKSTLKRVKEKIAKNLIIGNPKKVLKREVAKAFADGGLTAFITEPDKNGRRRRLRLDDYASIVVNTKLRETHTQAAVNRYQESGVDLVQINSHSPSCHVCARLQGKVISLTGKHPGFKSIHDEGVTLTPFHPRCRCTSRPYVITYKSEEEIQKEKDKWSGWSPNIDVRSKSQQAAYKKEQDIRRKTNDARKQYERMTAVLGKDKMPKTLGGFIRGKQSKSKTYLKLQQQYRQANRELKVQ